MNQNREPRRQGGPGGPRGVPMGKPKDLKKTIGRVLSYLKDYKLRLFFVMLCILINSGSAIAGT